MRANKAQVASHVAEGDNGHAAWDGVQADMHDVQLATVGTFRHIFETDELLQGLERRQALKDWVDLLAASHPLDRYSRWVSKALCPYFASSRDFCLTRACTMPVQARWCDGCLRARSCRAGAREIQLALPKLWPAEQAAAGSELRRMAICGEDVQNLEEVGAAALVVEVNSTHESAWELRELSLYKRMTSFGYQVREG